MDLSDVFSTTAIVLTAALAVGWAARMLGAPSIVGYLCTGVLLGPTLLGGRVFQGISTNDVTILGDVGLVLLLFTIGLELNPERLLQLGARLVAATLLQVAGTAFAAMFFIYWFVDPPFAAALVLGIGVSLSSTAIVLKVLHDRGEIHTTAGSISTGILLLQDIAVIAFMLLVPLIAPAGPGEAGRAALWTTAIGLLEFAAAVTIAHFLLPRAVRAVTQRGGHEVTALFALLAAAGGAMAAHHAGWPLEVGACIAGLLLARADVKHQLIADITPFRDIFNAIFFIALGMLVDFSVVVEHFWLLAGAIVLTLLVKAVLTSGAIVIAGWPLRHGIQIALGLCTVSEFAYVLAREANQYQLVSDYALRLLVPYAVGTMLLGALLVPFSAAIAQAVVRRVQPGHARTHDEADDSDSAQKGHVIIIGYGLNGQNLVRVSASTRIPHCVIEMNVTRVHRARENGARVIYGDAARMPILKSAGLMTARALVAAIDDVPTTRHIIAQARAARKDLYIVARTSHVAEIDVLKACGADVVIPAEFEVSIEIFSQVLKEFRIPDNVLRAQIASIRAGGYSVMRGLPYDRAAHLKELLEVFSTTATETYYVQDGSAAAHKTIAMLALRKATGASIIAVVRSGHPNANPAPDFEIMPGDVLILVGSHPELDAARARLDPSADTA